MAYSDFLNINQDAIASAVKKYQDTNQTNIKPIPSLSDMNTTTAAPATATAPAPTTTTAPAPTPDLSGIGTPVPELSEQDKKTAYIASSVKQDLAPVAGPTATTGAVAADGTTPGQLGTNTETPYAGNWASLADQATNDVITGKIDWNSIAPPRQVSLLESIDQQVAANPALFHEIQNPTVKEAYVAKYGDVQQGAHGAAANTIGEDGRVQGQYEATQGGAFQGEAAQIDSMTD